MCPTDFEPMYTACIPSALWEEFLTPSEAAVSFTHLYPTDPIYFPLTGEERSALLHALFPHKTLTLPEQTPPDLTQPATFHCQLICNPIYLCFNQRLKKKITTLELIQIKNNDSFVTVLYDPTVPFASFPSTGFMDSLASFFPVYA